MFSNISPQILMTFKVFIPKNHFVMTPSCFSSLQNARLILQQKKSNILYLEYDFI